MFRKPLLGCAAALALALPMPAATAGDGNSFLNQFRYDKSFDRPKYERYQKRSRKLENFGTSSSDYGSSNGSGLYFESDRITQPGNSGLRREDQKTQIKLKIQF